MLLRPRGPDAGDADAAAASGGVLVRCRDGDGSPVAVRLERERIDKSGGEDDESRDDEGQGGEHRGEKVRGAVVGVEVDKGDLSEGDWMGGRANLLCGTEKSGMDGSTESMMKVTEGKQSGMGEERRGERGDNPFTRPGSICASDRKGSTRKPSSKRTEWSHSLGGARPNEEAKDRL